MAEQIVFGILGVIIICCSIMAVATSKITHSAIYLLFVLLGCAGLYLMLNYPFLMAVQIAVYAGGIMVVMIFAILLTNQPGVGVKRESPWRVFTAFVMSFAAMGVCSHLIFYNAFRVVSGYYTNTQEMHETGLKLMGTDRFGYMLPFEAISVLLLGCIIGALMIARSEKEVIKK